MRPRIGICNDFEDVASKYHTHDALIKDNCKVMEARRIGSENDQHNDAQNGGSLQSISHPMLCVYKSECHNESQLISEIERRVDLRN